MVPFVFFPGRPIMPCHPTADDLAFFILCEDAMQTSDSFLAQHAYHGMQLSSSAVACRLVFRCHICGLGIAAGKSFGVQEFIRASAHIEQITMQRLAPKAYHAQARADGPGFWPSCSFRGSFQRQRCSGLWHCLHRCVPKYMNSFQRDSQACSSCGMTKSTALRTWR